MSQDFRVRSIAVSSLAVFFIASSGAMSGCSARNARTNDPAAARVEQSSFPGMRLVETSSDDMARSYWIYVPRSYKPGQKTPLILSFHGGSDNGGKNADYTQFPALAEREGFIVAFPNGTSLRGKSKVALTWNTGSDRGMGRAEKRGIDDVGFIKSVLGDIKRNYAIDDNRVYATGMSKGGMFSYLLGCEMPGEFAAIAPVAATMVASSCRPSQPVAIFAIHGSNDENVPIDGGRGRLTAPGLQYDSVIDTIGFWRTNNKCSADASTFDLGSDTTCRAYKSCARDVTFCVVEGGGHAWPGQTPQRWQERRDVYVTQSFDATQEIWRFFQSHPR